MTEPAPKRRLPILSSSGGGGGPSGSGSGAGPDEEQDRPAWHWSGIGVVAIFLAWLPLAMLAGFLIVLLAAGEVDDPQRSGGAGASIFLVILMVGLPLLTFAIASFAGGFMVGRFGGRAGKKEATVAGFTAAAVAWAMAAAQPFTDPGPGALVWSIILVLLAAVGMSAAYVGGRSGLRRRPRGLG
jgi:MFS family permease